MFKVECPGCKAPYQVDERRVPSSGLKMRCPKCGTSFMVESPAAEPRRTGPGPGVAAPPAPAQAAPAPPARPPPPARAKKATMLGVAAPPAPPRPPPRPGGAKQPPPPRRTAPAEDPYLDLDLPTVGGPKPQSEVDVAPSQTIDADLPQVAPPPRPAAGKSIDLDLPASLRSTPGAQSSGMKEPAADLPALAPSPGVGGSFGEIDLPALSGQAATHRDDLPAAPAPRAGAPSNDLSLDLPARHQPGSDLPALSDDLPALTHDAGDLPALSDDLPALGSDLPALGGELPMPGGNLPMPGGNLPMPGGNLPMPGADMPTSAANLPDRSRAAPRHADSFGELELPLVGGSGASPPIPVSAPGHGDDPFGGGMSAPPSSPDANIERQGGGGTSYGEVNLEGASEAAEVNLESVPPVSKREADDDMEFGAIPQERETAAATPSEELDAAPAPGPVGVAVAPRVQLPRPKRRGLRFAVAIIAILAIGGAALALVPALGPFGAYWILDHVRAGQYQQLVRSTVSEARQKLAGDLSPDAAQALAVVDRAREQAPRVEALGAYAAYVTYMTDLRFGVPPAALAKARVWLQERASDKDGDVEYLGLARAAQDADSNHLARARQRLQSLHRNPANEIDVDVLRGEVEIKAREPKAALAAWQAAAAHEQSARTAFGLALAEYALDDWASARKHAALTLEKNPKHVGAKILSARIAWTGHRQRKAALALLGQVLAERTLASSDEIVAAQTLRGQIDLVFSHVTDARKAFDDALRLDPKAAGALSGLGDALYRAGRYSEALARFEAATQADASDIGAQVGVAKTRLALEHPDDALALLKKLRAGHPKSMAVAYWYGSVEEALGERKEAEVGYRAAIQNSGNDAGVIDPYIALSLLLNQEGRADDAQKVLAEARAKLPDSAALHRGLGELALSQGRYDTAIAELKKALTLDPSDVRAEFRLAVAYTKHRDFDDAKKTFDAVEKVDTDYPGLALERGELYEAMGQKDQALKAYETALAKAPNDLDLMLRVGCGKVAAGRAKEAEELLHKVLEQRPQSAETNACLGRALLSEGTNPAEALKTLQRAVELDPHNAEYYMYVGWAANEAGQVATAERALARALELDQGLGDAYWQRGVLRYRQGAVKDAVKDLQKALDLNPGRYEAHAALADAYNDLGKETDAMNEWQKAVTADPNKADWHFRYGKMLGANRRNADAEEQLKQSISLGSAQAPPPPWMWEAHLLLARALGRQKQAVAQWQAFLREGPADSPYRGEAKNALAHLGHPWQGD
jgi:predicted Zn finger-like uncharacterized protein